MTSEEIVSLQSGTLTTYEHTHSMRINWSTEVSFEDYKEILLAAADAARNGYKNVIIDRSELGELPAECRVWMKNEYLKDHVTDVIPVLSKVAIIQSRSILGQVYFSTISKAVPLKYPNLAFKSFNSEKEAMEWIDQSQDQAVGSNGVDTKSAATNASSKNSIFEAILRLFK